jgi:hypothetical protein
MKIQLLSNEPCRKDAFEGHSHQHIADQIVRIINEDADRHIIGIEGGWGSGKSNLISLVNKGLNGDTVYDKGFNHKASTFPFFVYDAWGHQVDYQRRAILEELTHDLTLEKKILDKAKWETKLQELLAKRRKTTTKEVPRLGVGFIVSIILTILTPLVVFLVGIVPDDLWWLKVIVALLPYLTGIGYAIQNRKNSLKEHEQECTWQNILSELILVYKDQIKENETYTTVSEKEPSSAEFKKWMDEVDMDLKALNKHLVIVFDNMDRLPAQKVESLWSSIHSFFSDKTYDNIKVLIPFDRQHVQLAFKNEDTEGESYGNDFINKTFDVVFRVPPPIMTGWQQYMTDMWKKAFGEDAQLHISVTQIYDALSKNHTPRKIIAFINEVATVKMTMHDDIPDRYIALFVFGKELIDKDPIGQLLNLDFMGSVKFEYENDPDTIKYLSALYYQLPVDKALDVVFTREATEALNNGDAERLHDMMEHMDLSPILGKSILNVTDVEKATMALADVDGFVDYGELGKMPGWLAKIWDDLYQKCKEKNVDWSAIKEFHVSLYKHLYDEDLAERLVTGYLSVEDENWDVELYVDTINQLREENDVIDRQLEKHKRKVSPKLFIELLAHTKDKYEKYGVMYDKTEVDDYLAALERNEAIAINVIPYIKLDKKESFDEFEAKLKEWIGNANLRDVDDIRGLFTRLKEVEGKPVSFEDYFDDTRIYNAWSQIENTGNKFKYDLLAMRIARGNSFQSSYRGSFRDTIDAPDQQDIKNLAKVIEYYIDYGDLLLNSDTYKEYPIVVEVFKDITVNSYGSSKAHIMECLKHFDTTVDDYGMDEKQLYKNLSLWKRWFDFSQTTVDEMPSGLMTLSLSIDNELTKALHQACEKYYSTLTQEQWKEHILAEDDTYRIWKIYHPKKYQENFDALKKILKDCAGNVNASMGQKELWTEWLGICMEVKHQVKGLFNEVSGILKRDSRITKEKLLFFGPLILEHADIDKQSDFVEKLIPSEMIDGDVIAFIAKHIDRLKDCVIPDEFKEKVKHLAETTMQDDEDIRTICEAIGIEVEEEEESTDEKG